jgi:hypothetical protein
MIEWIFAANTTISQRGVYYSLKSLFRNQLECNAMILELGLYLGLRRRKQDNTHGIVLAISI